MKNKLINNTGLAIAAMLLTTSLSASDEANKFGLGIQLDTDTSYVIRGTIDLEDDMRIEPYFGFLYSDDDFVSSTDFQIGAALHWTKSISDKVNMYYGAYAGYLNADAKFGTSLTAGAADISVFHLGPVAGVEYYLADQVSLGAEVRAYVGFGDATIFSTDSNVVLRYYFN